MKYSQRDIVKTVDIFGERLMLILEVNAFDYTAMELKTKKRYVLAEHQITERIGDVEEGSKLLKEVEYDVMEGQEFAAGKALACEGDDRHRWQLLSRLKPGQRFAVIHRNVIYDGELVRLNMGRPKHVFSAKILGRQYAFPLEAIYLR